MPIPWIATYFLQSLYTRRASTSASISFWPFCTFLHDHDQFFLKQIKRIIVLVSHLWISFRVGRVNEQFSLLAPKSQDSRDVVNQSSAFPFPLNIFASVKQNILPKCLIRGLHSIFNDFVPVSLSIHGMSQDLELFFKGTLVAPKRERETRKDKLKTNNMMMIRRHWAGMSPSRTVSQHSTITKPYENTLTTSKSSSPPFFSKFGSLTVQIACVSSLHGDVQLLQPSFQRWSSLFSVAYLSPDRLTYKDLSRILLVKKRQRHLGSHKKSSSIPSHMIPSSFETNLVGSLEVYHEKKPSPNVSSWHRLHSERHCSVQFFFFFEKLDQTETDLCLPHGRIFCTDTFCGSVTDFTRQNFLLPLTHIFGQFSAESSHIRSSMSFRFSLHWDITKETHCDIFTSHWKITRPQSSLCFPSVGFERKTLITDRVLLLLLLLLAKSPCLFCFFFNISSKSLSRFTVFVSLLCIIGTSHPWRGAVAWLFSDVCMYSASTRHSFRSVWRALPPNLIACLR